MDSYNHAVAAVSIVDLDAWADLFDSAFARIAGRFSRVEPRRAARDFLLGLLSDVDTRFCWQLADRMATPNSAAPAIRRTSERRPVRGHPPQVPADHAEIRSLLSSLG